MLDRLSRLVFGLAAMALLSSGSAHADASFNVVYHSSVIDHFGDPGALPGSTFHYNDIWGYTSPGGDDYAICGLYNGVTVVNVSDPYEPYEVGFFPDIGSPWRDVKTYQNYAYITNESGGGLMILDLTDPENPVRLSNYTGFGTAHNLYIDTTVGHCYISGSNLGAGGVRILDLANPTNPVEIGSWETVYFHDVMVQDGRLYGSAINVGDLYILDVSNPASVSTIATTPNYPDPFTHNAWVTADNNYVMTTDENNAGRCRMWDISNLPTMVETDSYKPNAITIPHNAHIEGDLAIVSFYTVGVRILDISDPANLVEVAGWDTWPSDDGGSFNGNWGAFPFFGGQQDLIAITDGTTGLHLLSYKENLGTISGTITEQGSASPIEGATVKIVASGYRGFSDVAGDYSVMDTQGTYDVEVSAPGYVTEVVTNVVITSGGTTTLDEDLVALPRGDIQGTVTSATSTLPLEGAVVEVISTNFSETTGAPGTYSAVGVVEGTYTVRATAFGYRPAEATVVVTGGSLTTVDFPLNDAFVTYDFETAQGWTTPGGSATRGLWERANPQGTFSSGIPVQPEDDHTPGGTLCWVTEAASGSSIGTGDVDGGATILQSPNHILGSATDPRVNYWRWYSTGIGNANVDNFVVEVSSNGGGSWVEMENTFETTNAWVNFDLRIADYVTPTNLIAFRFTAQDTGSGSIIEAALDDFMIYDGVDIITVPTSTPELGVANGFALSAARPNPLSPGAVSRLELALPNQAPVEAGVFDVTGRKVAELVNQVLPEGRHVLEWNGAGGKGRPVSSGVYFVRVQSGEVSESRKVMVLR